MSNDRSLYEAGIGVEQVNAPVDDANPQPDIRQQDSNAMPIRNDQLPADSTISVHEDLQKLEKPQEDVNRNADRQPEDREVTAVEKNVISTDELLFAFEDLIKKAEAEEAALPRPNLDKPCSAYRWYRAHLKRGSVPMRGGDSLWVEIKFRIEENVPFGDDDPALGVRDTQMKHVKSKGAKICVLNDYYEVNDEFNEVKAIYGGEHRITISREVWFMLFDGNKIVPLDSAWVVKIEKHLERFIPTRAKKIPDALELEHGVWIKWSDVERSEIDRDGKRFEVLHGYPEEAKCDDGRFETIHVVFVVHGVGHLNDEDSVYLGAKQIGKGVTIKEKALAPESKAQVMFIGIHWRNFIENDPHHSCKGTMALRIAEMLRRTPHCSIDALLYTCEHCAERIRVIVADAMREKFAIFKSHHPNFNGLVSLLGHSLGSVICYDIRTCGVDYKLDFSIETLFTVASPIPYFLKLRGKEALKAFKENLSSIRVINTYHPMDYIAKRFEPYVDKSFWRVPPTELPLSENYMEEQRIKKRRIVPAYLFMQYHKLWNSFRSRTCAPFTEESDKWLKTKPRIDYELEEHYTVLTFLSHSLYWTHSSFHCHLVDLLFKQAPGQPVAQQKPEVDEENLNDRGAAMPAHEGPIDPKAFTDSVLVSDLGVPVVNNQKVVQDLGKLAINAVEEPEAVAPVQV